VILLSTFMKGIVPCKNNWRIW